ncbi:MAG: hypothetical protein EBZ59_07910 [Planctomycetia bacterium]|nr:hypothetical protein [Planctomycetia bacterium]
MPRALRESPLFGRLGCGAPVRLGTVVHTVTHHRIALDVVACPASRRGRAGAGRAWVMLRQLERLAMTSPGRRIAGMVD